MSGQPPNAAGAGHKAAAAQPGPHAEAVRQLFKEAIPTILHHRCSSVYVLHKDLYLFGWCAHMCTFEGSAAKGTILGNAR